MADINVIENMINPLSNVWLYPANSAHPLPPINLDAQYSAQPNTVTQNSNVTGIKLTWQINLFSPDTVAYKVYKNDVCITGTAITDLFHTDTNDDGETYVSYSVTAIDAEGNESARSEIISNYSAVIDRLISDLRAVLRDNWLTSTNPPQPDYCKRKYSDAELLIQLRRALNDINVTPVQTTYTFEQANNEWYDLLLTGGQIYASISQGLLEVGKEFSYSDNGKSITINRSASYKSFADSLLTNYVKQRDRVKLNQIMKFSGAGIVSSPIAFKIRTYSPRQWRVR